MTVETEVVAKARRRRPGDGRRVRSHGWEWNARAGGRLEALVVGRVRGGAARGALQGCRNGRRRSPRRGGGRRDAPAVARTGELGMERRARTAVHSAPRADKFLFLITMGKSTYARCGIITSVTPFEPEWEGFVTLEISNTTPLPAKIYANEGIAHVVFFEATDVCEVSYKDRGGKYQKQVGITLPRI